MKIITRAAVLLVLGLASISAYPQKPADGSPTQKYFGDIPLTNQDGQKLRLYTDLLKGRVVVINVFFATCNGSCPVMTRNLVKMQDALGDRFGRDIHFMSITVDPMVDTPPNLKAYAKTYKAKPGWDFLTGDKVNIDLALTKLGQYVDDKQAHSNIFIIGNEPTGLWKKAFGLATPEELLKVVESVLNDKGDIPAVTTPSK